MVQMHAITPAERAMVELVDEGTYEAGSGCRFSQDMLAARARDRGLRCSREHANRCIRHLEFLGLVWGDKQPRRGECRTLHAFVFNPSNRSRVKADCARLRPELKRLQSRRLAKHHTNRTACPAGANPRGTEHRLNVVNQRCGSRESEFRGFERSRGVPEPARALRLVDCPQCEKYRRMLDALEVDLQNAETSLRAERRQKNEARAEARKWKSHREREAKETPNIELIQRLWEFHRQHVRPLNRKLDLKTIEAVRDRLADTLPESDEPAYSPRYVAEAILGAKYEAFVDSNGKRHDQLELICRDPKHLEDFHERWERRQGPRFVSVDGIEVREDGF